MPHFIDQSNSLFTRTLFLPYISPRAKLQVLKLLHQWKKNYQILKRLGWGRWCIILMDSIPHIYLESLSVFRSGHMLLSNTLSNLDTGRRPLNRSTRDSCKAGLTLFPAFFRDLRSLTPPWYTSPHTPWAMQTPTANPWGRDQTLPLSVPVLTCPSSENPCIPITANYSEISFQFLKTDVQHAPPSTNFK